MKFCSQCGAQINDGQKFCSGCGALASTPGIPSAPPVAKSTAVPATPVPDAAPKNNNTLMIVIGIGIVAVLLLVIGIVAVVVLGPSLLSSATGITSADSSGAPGTHSSFFDTEKSTESVRTGVTQESSPFEIVGNVYGMGSGGVIRSIQFTVALAPGAYPVDFDEAHMTYTVGSRSEELNHNMGVNSNPLTGSWGITKTINDQGTPDTLLEQYEQFQLTVKPSSPVSPDQKFTIELKPPAGSSLGISRTTPSSIASVNILY